MIPFLETALVGDHLHSSPGMDPEIVMAFWTDIIIPLYVLRKDGRLTGVALFQDALRRFRPSCLV